MTVRAIILRKRYQQVHTRIEQEKPRGQRFDMLCLRGFKILQQLWDCI